VNLIETDKNLGFGKANNIGIHYAMEQDCDYVFLLNQDAWILPDTIEKLYVLMEENPEF
jgi:GT2 family glycosyltransferase